MAKKQSGSVGPSQQLAAQQAARVPLSPDAAGHTLESSHVSCKKTLKVGPSQQLACPHLPLQAMVPLSPDAAGHTLQ